MSEIDDRSVGPAESPPFADVVKIHGSTPGAPTKKRAKHQDEPRTPGDIVLLQDGTHPCSGVANAERFTAWNRHHVLYVEERKGWLVYDGRRWKADPPRVERLAEESIRRTVREASKLAHELTVRLTAERDGDPSAAEQTEKERNALGRLVRHAERSQNIRGVKEVLDLARPHLSVRAAELDCDPFLFNCANGTIDLRTGDVRAPSAADRITRLSPVSYDVNAASERWQRALLDWTGGDADLVAYIQRAAGYSLTGDTREEVFFFAQGPENSGKSTFIAALLAAMGDYAGTIPFASLLIESRRGASSARSDLSSTIGRRAVFSSEAPEDGRWDEPLLQNLTGRDTVSVRDLYEKQIEFIPTFKLWLVANDLPKARDTNGALWRRLRRLPLDHTVPPERRDPTLKSFLTDPARGAAAVLAWLVAGCLYWQQAVGLGACDAVTDAGRAYREEMDPLGQFFAERVVFEAGDASAIIPRTALYRAYTAWAEHEGQKFVIAPAKFYKRVQDRLGHHEARKSRVEGVNERVFVGVRWRLPEEAQT